MYDLYITDNWNKKVDNLLKSFRDQPCRLPMLEKLADAFMDYLQLDDVEFGGWGIDSKRPFGNSFVERDIAEIVGIELPDEEENSEEYDEICRFLRDLYYDLGVFIRWKWLRFREMEKINEK